MGIDKALLRRDGESLLERTARLASGQAERVWVIGRERPPDWPFAGVAFAPDDAPGAGPLAALATVLRRTGGPALLLSCDLPQIERAGLDWLWARFDARAEPDGVVAVVDGKEQPLFAVYAPSCRPTLERLLAAGRRAMRDLLEAGSFDRADAPPELARLLVNVNTPEEWSALLRRESGEGR